jgi:hypothetical protein
MSTLSPVRRLRTRAFALRSAVVLGALASGASAGGAGGRDVAGSAYLAPGWNVASPRFWWPAVVFERASTNLTGERSVDETRFGLMLAYRTSSLSPHVRALISPSLGTYQNLAGAAGAGVRVHFELGGVALSYGVGISIEARLRDSLWLAYATPIELGMPLYRGTSAEHHVFVGARRSMGGALINSYLLDPNGYDNEDSLDRLRDLRDDQAWQLYVSLVFGRRVE